MLKHRNEELLTIEKDEDFFKVLADKKEKQPIDNEGLYIGENEVREALQTLEKYRAAKMNLENRIKENEEWFRLRHWEQMRTDKEKCKRQSAWLFNSIINKHADFMDAIPECTVLPREESDTKSAEELTSILPVILERSDWDNVYSDAAFSKLKTGTAVYSVLWDPDAENGLGDVDIRQSQLLNLFWEPGIRDIQKSRNLFYVELADNDILIEKYPFLLDKLSGNTAKALAYSFDPMIDTSCKSAVVDWYYKKRVGNKTVLHYCKFCEGQVLYASENDPELQERGWYDHALYPFVFDPLFKEEGTPIGFGYIDIMKGAQEEIDLLGEEIIKNARMAARRRYFTRNEGAINEEEFADFSKDFVHVSGSSLGEDSIREITYTPLSSVYVSVLNNKISELKETSGNRDFVTGGTTGGVTSGTAISALQEMGSKLSRDMIHATYHAFTKVCELTIELIRQFYSVPRSMRILGTDGEWHFSAYDNCALTGTLPEMEFGIEYASRRPVFDVTVKAHKMNAFTRSAQNADALNFYQLGFFNPANAKQSLACLQLIDIENKEKLMRVIEENGREYLYSQSVNTKNAQRVRVPGEVQNALVASVKGDASP